MADEDNKNTGIITRETKIRVAESVPLLDVVKRGSGRNPSAPIFQKEREVRSGRGS
jgi:hypothetical protein